MLGQKKRTDNNKLEKCWDKQIPTYEIKINEFPFTKKYSHSKTIQNKYFAINNLR